MSKLNYFTNTSSGNNTTVFLPKTDCFDEIVIGANCWHVIRLPFTQADTEYIASIKFLELIYKQGNVGFTVNVMDQEIGYDEISYIANINLTPEQTSVFKPNSTLDTYCQLKVTLNDGTISYDNQHKVKLFTPIDMEAN